MKRTYNISGMTCKSCEAKVTSALVQLPEVISVEVSKDTSTAIIETDLPINLNQLSTALAKAGDKYQIGATEAAQPTRSWLETYKPILLIFGYVTTISVVASASSGGLDGEIFMRVFMAGFFLTFSFFKLLDLRGFAESYAMYDLIAKRFKIWGYFYAFLELGLGIAFALDFEPVFTNSVTFVVMSVSILGVLQSVLNKRQIKCACLGSVFNLPMTTVTIVEDALMIGMSGLMLWNG